MFHCFQCLSLEDPEESGSRLKDFVWFFRPNYKQLHKFYLAGFVREFCIPHTFIFGRNFLRHLCQVLLISRRRGLTWRYSSSFGLNIQISFSHSPPYLSAHALCILKLQESFGQGSFKSEITLMSMLSYLSFDQCVIPWGKKCNIGEPVLF